MDRPTRANSHDVGGCVVFTWLLIMLIAGAVWWTLAVWKAANR